MEKTQRVIVYGSTLMLAAIEVGIGQDPSCLVIHLALDATCRELLEWQPDVLIFDRDEVKSGCLLARLQAQPDLLLIGIDPESHEVLLTGEAARSITLDQITRILRSRNRSEAAD